MDWKSLNKNLREDRSSDGITKLIEGNDDDDTF